MRVISQKASQNASRIFQIFDIQRLKDAKLETPLLLYMTKGAHIPHVSKEVFDDSLNSVNQAFLVSMTNTFHMAQACEKLDKSLLEFAGFPKIPQVLTLKDPTVEVTERPQERDAVGLFLRSGRIALTSDAYMKAVETCRPDIYEALSDNDTGPESSKKRISKVVERSETFLLQCVEKHKSSSQLASSLLIAPVQGGYSEHERQKHINFLLENDDESIGAYSIEGLHLRGVSAACLDFKNIKHMVELCTSSLPANKPRFMYGAYNPLTLLHLVASGIDVFDSSYAFLATQASKVLTFSFNDLDTNNPFALDLKDEVYKEDFKPFMDDCKCLACQKMTRAYVYHLCNCRELLANTLILIHNLYHYSEFFKIIRKAVLEDSLDDLITCLSQQYKELDLSVDDKKEKAFGL